MMTTSTNRFAVLPNMGGNIDTFTSM